MNRQTKCKQVWHALKAAYFFVPGAQGQITEGLKCHSKGVRFESSRQLYSIKECLSREVISCFYILERSLQPSVENVPEVNEIWTQTGLEAPQV